MGILLLPATAIIIYLLVQPGRALRTGLMISVVIWGALLVLITEGLSLFQQINQTSLLLCWGALSAAGLSWLVINGLRKKSFPVLIKEHPLDLKKIWQRRYGLLLLLGLLWLALMGLLAVTAWHYAPNNWDSMTYHLARIVHWQQQNSVTFYATHIDRQIQLQPGAEFILLHMQILSGGDQFANLLQWVALLFGSLNISWIARKFGANGKGQVFAAIFCWTLPMAILQASSTQNDLVVSAWLSAFIALSLELMDEPRTLLYQIGCGLALGLAILTKATAYVYALPFCLLIAYTLFKKLSFSALQAGFLIGLLAIGINLGHYSRNYQLYQSPLGPQTRYENETHSPQAMASNIIRNLGLHATFAVDFTEPYDTLALRVVKKVHNLTGMDPVDPRTSFAAKSPFALRAAPDEDYAGNPLHLLLIGLSLCLLTWQAGKYVIVSIQHKQKWSVSPLAIYTLALIFSFLFFCIYLKWQIWNSRLHLPLFMLLAPVVVSGILKAEYRFSPYLLLCLLLASAIPLFFNNTRPADPSSPLWQETRIAQYFIRRPELEQPFEEISHLISASGCREVGLDFNEDTWEYPFWVLLRQETPPVTIRHIRVGNASAVLMPADYQPCAIISEYKSNDYGSRYQTVFTYEQFALSLLSSP